MCKIMAQGLLRGILLVPRGEKNFWKNSPTLAQLVRAGRKPKTCTFLIEVCPATCRLQGRVGTRWKANYMNFRCIKGLIGFKILLH